MGSTPHVQGKWVDRRGAWANPHVRGEKRIGFRGENFVTG